MRKSFVRALFCLLLVSALSPAVFADSSPAQYVVIPEAIWASASGGGTWVTALQVYSTTQYSTIMVRFFYDSGYREVAWIGAEVSGFVYRTSNILQALGQIDTGFDYFGKVGTLLIYSSPGGEVWAHAMTTNGNFGKTMPGFVWSSTENTAAIGRDMVIPGIMNSATYRTFTGFWNSTTSAMTVNFYIKTCISSSNCPSYSFQVEIPANGFLSFNPFVQAGISSTSMSNAYLQISPLSGGTGGEGLFCFGSIANNTTNDSYALTAIPRY